MIDKFVSSLLLRLDESLPKLVEFMQWIQSSQTEESNLALNVHEQSRA